jgi:hypothetical protein
MNDHLVSVWLYVITIFGFIALDFVLTLLALRSNRRWRLELAAHRRTKDELGTANAELARLKTVEERK